LSDDEGTRARRIDPRDQKPRLHFAHQQGRSGPKNPSALLLGVVSVVAAATTIVS
jgi:hypothetical protein